MLVVSLLLQPAKLGYAAGYYVPLALHWGLRLGWRLPVVGKAILGSAILCGSLSASAQSCEQALEGTLSADSPAYAVAFRTQPANIEVGRHFSVELIVCPKAGAGAADAVRVDGFMPEHGHGMNYKATVTRLADGRYRAAGMMFHMPGRWDFIFDVRAGGKTERLKRSIVVQ